MIWVFLLGCGPGLPPMPGDTDSVSPPDPGPIEWSVQPRSLAFGDTPLGHPVASTITLSNTGETELFVLDPGDDDEAELEVTLDQAPLLPAGGSTQLEVTWTPTRPGTLDTNLHISLGGSEDDAQPVVVRVPVDGEALGAIATISPSAHDFGRVGVGCEDELSLTLTNTGNVELEVESVTLECTEEFRATENIDLPWVLSPLQSRGQRIYFSPEQLGEAYCELVFETDLGIITVELKGEGVADEERTLTFDIGEQARSTIIVDVNITAIPDSPEDLFSAHLVASLPTFFQTLLDTDTVFRAGFVWSTTGTIDGDYAYIDETFTAAEATAAALEMLGRGVRGGDNDMNFFTLDSAIAANSDWLFEDADWAASKLNLITIQRDTEQSSGSWSHWVSQAQATKDDPDKVVYHAIAGPVPGGCGSADAFADYDLAVHETGGFFGSICEPDWTTNMAQIATACIDGVQGIFSLEGIPVDSTIEVSLDSVVLTEGWAYNATSNAVVFEDNAYPAFDSIVEIYYRMAGSCS